MAAWTVVMPFESGGNVAGQTRVMTTWIGVTSQDVHESFFRSFHAANRSRNEAAAIFEQSRNFALDRTQISSSTRGIERADTAPSRRPPSRPRFFGRFGETDFACARLRESDRPGLRPGLDEAASVASV